VTLYDRCMRRALLTLTLGACSFRPGSVPSDDARGMDTTVADAMVDAALGPFGAATVVVLAAPTDTDDDPTLTGDMLEMFINASSRTANADVFVTTRASLASAWSTPMYVMNVSSTANETTPEVSLDGLTMIVASDRQPTLGGNDLWLFTRSSRTGTWSTGTALTELDSTTSEAAGNMTDDGKTIVFSSQRVNGSPDLFTADRTGASGPFGNPVEQTALNTAGHEGSPHMTPDGLTVYFDTDRVAPGTANLDIYVSHRASRTDMFPAPVPITEINTGMSEQDPWISPDGHRLLFSSDRGGSNQLWEATR